MNKVPAERFGFVDGLRGIAAMAVVLFHLKEGHHIPLLISIFPSWLVFVIDQGNLGVAIFFVLSGFVIAHSLSRERVTMSLAGRFMLRRSVRLDPPYWAAIALSVGFAVLSSIAAHKPNPSVTFGQVLTHLFYLQEILQYPEINSVFWTLCLEVQFYLLYVLMLFGGRNDPLLPAQGRRLIFVLSGSMVVSLLWPVELLNGEPWPGSFLPLWHGFLLGVAAYWAWRYRQYRMIYAAFALIIFVSALLHSNAFSFTCTVVATLLLSAGIFGGIYTSLDWGWLRFLGSISYSLYLIHNPVTGASFWVGYSLTGHTLIAEIIWSLCAIGACILFSFGFHVMIEKPSMKLARKIRLQSSPSVTN